MQFSYFQYTAQSVWDIIVAQFKLKFAIKIEIGPTVRTRFNIHFKTIKTHGLSLFGALFLLLLLNA